MLVEAQSSRPRQCLMSMLKLDGFLTNLVILVKRCPSCFLVDDESIMAINENNEIVDSRHLNSRQSEPITPPMFRVWVLMGYRTHAQHSDPILDPSSHPPSKIVLVSTYYSF